MKFNSTRIGNLLLFVILGVTSAFAQTPNILTVTAPADVAGRYTVVQPLWGEQVTTLSGTGILANDGVDVVSDGCDGMISNAAGLIAFIDRGQCEFGTKGLSAEDGMAIGAVVCNNVPLQGPPSMAAGTTGDLVNIPVFGMSFENCATLRMALEAGTLEGTFAFECAVPGYDDTVIWGDEPGQGDFNGGLNDWTVVNESGDTSWAYTEDLTITGAFTNSIFSSATSCNGFMSFPSDLWDNDGDPAQLGLGINCFAPCEGELISPEIQITDPDVEGLFVQFTQSYRNFTDTQTEIIASYDGGATFPDTLRTEQFAVVNAAVITERVDIPLASYNGESSVIIKFRHSGNYYFYALDDIVLVNASFVDINVNREFFGAAPIYTLPATQAQEVPFHVDIFNRGNLLADAQIDATVVSPSGDVVFETSNTAYSPQPPFEFINDNSTFREAFVPTDPVLGQYRATYRNVNADDPFEANDTLSFGFNYTERTLETAPLAAATGGIFDGVIFSDPLNQFYIGDSYAVGYSFYLPNGEGEFLNTVTFGVEDLATNSGSVNIYLYLWNPTEASTDDNTFPGTYQISSDDTRLLGVLGENTVGQQGPQIINPQLGSQTEMTVRMALANANNGLPETDANGELVPLPLQDDQRYVMVFALTPTLNSQLSLVSAGADANAIERQWTTPGTNLAMDTLQLERFYGATLQSLTSGDFEEVDNLTFDGVIAGGNFATLFDNNMPYIRMDISSSTTVSTEDLAADDSHVIVYPNPAVDFIHVDLALQQVSPNVNIEVMDIHGKLVKSMSLNNVTQELVKISTQGLTPGMYNVNVRSEEGFVSKKVMVTAK